MICLNSTSHLPNQPHFTFPMLAIECVYIFCTCTYSSLNPYQQTTYVYVCIHMHRSAIFTKNGSKKILFLRFFFSSINTSRKSLVKWNSSDSFLFMATKYSFVWMYLMYSIISILRVFTLFPVFAFKNNVAVSIHEQISLKTSIFYFCWIKFQEQGC